MKKRILLFAGLAILTFKNHAQTVTDIDGNIYNTVTIGTQVWMKENLKVTHYRNGDLIPYVTDNNIWWNILVTGARCYYDNDSATYDSVYGALYNWYVVDDNRYVCPAGWHVPSNSEWTTLTSYIGGTSGNLKEADTIHWASPNTGATNSSGFTGLPGGFRTNISYEIRKEGIWWCSTEYDSVNAWDRWVIYNSIAINDGGTSKKGGESIRCLMDSPTEINDINYQGEIKIYPNPTLSRIYINSDQSQNFKMQIFNIIGECLLQSQLTSGTNEIDVSLLPKGIYVIKLMGSGWTIQRKLTKE